MDLSAVKDVIKEANQATAVGVSFNMDQAKLGGKGEEGKKGPGRPKKDKGKEPATGEPVGDSGTGIFSALKGVKEFIVPTPPDPVNYMPPKSPKTERKAGKPANADEAHNEKIRLALISRLNIVLCSPEFKRTCTESIGYAYAPLDPATNLESAKAMEEEINKIQSLRFWQIFIDRGTEQGLKIVENFSSQRVPLYGYSDFYKVAKADVRLEQLELAAILAKEVGSMGPLGRYVLKIAQMGATVYAVNSDPAVREAFLQKSFSMNMNEEAPDDLKNAFPPFPTEQGKPVN